ncbi:MAG: tetratricopeptide (TPR) repeat protein [Patiriisocius sp.]
MTLPFLSSSLSLGILLLVSGLVSADSVDELMQAGNLLRLNGDMTAANEVKQKIRGLAPEAPHSYSFSLNTIVTELSWEESQTRFDQALVRDAEHLIRLCTESPAAINNSNYYCGQAHFTLSYFNGIRGNYIRAGRHGTTAIDYLEAALVEDPDLIRAKMYLGVAYYYADHLPPFIKLFSKFLWFIPSGSSDKSLPYLRQVMDSEDTFNDVARYIYATLLVNGKPEEVADALSVLNILIKRYPKNARFQLRYVSVIVGDQRYVETLERISTYLVSEHAASLSKIDINLLNIWAARAHLGLGQVERAVDLQRKIQFDPVNTTVPAWGLAWYELTNGQLADVTGNRKKAIVSYQKIVALDEKTFVNPTIVSLAIAALTMPYKLPGRSPTQE